MRLIKIVKLLSLAGILVLNSCMSGRTTTNLKPESNPELKSPAGKFYIEGIKYTNNIPKEQQKQSISDFNESIVPLVRKECIARYPELFSADSSSSIPLWVEVTHYTTNNDGKTITWMFCSLMLCGIIFPLPGEVDEQFDIKTGVWNGQQGIKGTFAHNNFERDSYFWVSVFTPSALITIPGESDFPKVSGTIFNINSQMAEYQALTAEQIATAIAKSVAEKDLGFWSARPLILKGTQSIPEAIQPSANQADAF